MGLTVAARSREAEGDAPGLFDSHCHLADRVYASDLDEVVSRARLAGVVGMLCVGYDLRSSRAAVAVAERYDDIWAAVGVHPHYAGEAARNLSRLAREIATLARRPKVVAVGETGLDFYRDLSPRPAQRDVFHCHIEVARELGLPLLVHDRDAHEEALAILGEHYRPQTGGGGRRTEPGLAGEGGRRTEPGLAGEGGRTEPGLVGEGGRTSPAPAAGAGSDGSGAGIMHCFSGDERLAIACVGLGFYISFAGPLTYPKSESMRRAAATVPRERLLVETDSPYLAPQSHRGRRNEPAFVAEVVAALGKARGSSAVEVARQTTANANRVFGLSG